MYSKTTLLVILSAIVGSSLSLPTPPPVGKTASRARYAVNNADWGVIASISTVSDIRGYPFSSVVSISDGPIGNGTGVAYTYITKYDLISIDYESDPRCTLTVSLASTGYCTTNNFDPEDPRCIRVMITGKFVKVDPKSEEHKTAYNYLIERHPQMKYWPADHGFYVAKVDMERITVLDYFGSLKTVTVDEYLNAQV